MEGCLGKLELGWQLFIYFQGAELEGSKRATYLERRELQREFFIMISLDYSF